MKYLPLALIYARLLAGLLILGLSLTSIAFFKPLAIGLLSFGVVSDVLDGIIARRLGVSTRRLRRMDSTVDQIFFCATALATYFRSPQFFSDHSTLLLILFGLEGLTYLVSFIKFRKEVATHSIGAKIWTIFLFATLIDLLANGQSSTLFTVCFSLGVLTRLEIIAILLVLKQWTNDVPSVYHSIRLRQGKAIKRHKLFNG